MLELSSLKNERVVLNIVNFIESHLDDNLKLNDILLVSEYKRRHTLNIFKEIVGTSVSKYIKRRQLSRAAIQLIYTNKKIFDIAIESNYLTTSSFYKAFKKMFNTTPEHYRNKKIIDFSIFQGDFSLRDNNYTSLGIVEKEFSLYGKCFTYNETILERPNPLNSQKKYRKIINTINTHGGKVFAVTHFFKMSDVENVVHLKVFLGKPCDNCNLQISKRRYYSFHFSGYWEDYIQVVRKIYIHGCFLKGEGNEVECFYYDEKSDEDHNNLTALLYIPVSDT